MSFKLPKELRRQPPLQSSRLLHDVFQNMTYRFAVEIAESSLEERAKCANVLGTIT